MSIDPSAKIHPSAVVEEGAVIGPDCQIGPFAMIGPEVTLGRGVVVKSHGVVTGWTDVGEETVIFSFAVVGEVPQDLKFRGGGVTQIGDDCLLMTGSHVGHDARLGDRVILANQAAIAGHCQLGDDVIVGGLSGVHQWVRVGRGAIIGAVTMVTNDVLPHGLVQGPRGVLDGLNLVGLKRRGVDRAEITALRAGYQMLAQGDGSFLDRARRLADETDSVHVREMTDFILSASDRSFLTPK